VKLGKYRPGKLHVFSYTLPKLKLKLSSPFRFNRIQVNEPSGQ